MLQIFSGVTQLFSQCIAWFFQLLDAVEGVDLWLTGIVIWLAYKFILAPVFGVASSDMAKRNYNSLRRKGE